MNTTTCFQCGQPIDEYGAYIHEGECFCHPRCIHQFKIDIATSSVPEQLFAHINIEEKQYTPSQLFFA
jgi:recombinational DNA repair protein (RecF pathway)